MKNFNNSFLGRIGKQPLATPCASHYSQGFYLDEDMTQWKNMCLTLARWV